MHVTVHYNGWGDFPNPKGYTKARIHGPIEGAFVYRNVSVEHVRSRLKPSSVCTQPIDACFREEIKESWALVEPLYALEKAGGFSNDDPRGRDFLAERLAVGASRLRDHVIGAWNAAGSAKVGWPATTVADIEAGKVDPYTSLYGVD
jgi:hypothetical protein